ncbi:MAG TPA: TetR family transcriptional regulator [Caulobacteraceae bacterium]|jgi:TetR/AcrR family transcriptional repressor of nem operon|nr:TetR family transcriptional regulator [Caulobacteraceae bacterium]
MGHSREHKAQSRARILELAAGRIRQEGLGVSIAELMQAAGLTHGGFYKHFDARDELVVEALRRAVAHNAATYAEHGGESLGLAGYLRGYISRTHRDGTGEGCALAALAAEVARADEPTRSVFTQGVRAALSRVRAMLGRSDDRAEMRAMLIVSAAVGAVTLARAVNDAALSDALVSGVRRALLALETE